MKYIVDEFLPLLMKLVKVYAPNIDKEVIENIVFDTILTLPKLLENYKSIKNLQSYIRVVLKHRLYDLPYYTSKETLLDTNEIDNVINKRSLSPEKDFITKDILKENMKILEEAIQILSDHERQVLLLFSVENISMTSIAEILNISKDRSYFLLSRAKKKLYNYFIQQGMELESH